jgi:hypothetical protein
MPLTCGGAGEGNRTLMTSLEGGPRVAVVHRLSVRTVGEISMSITICTG